MNSSAVVAIDAGTLYTPHEKISPARIVIEGSSIVEAGPIDSVRVPSPAERVDARPFIVTPGFIEPHIHGCGGVDVMEATYDALNVMSRIVARHGVTSFLPATVSAPIPVLTAALQTLGESVKRKFDGAQPAGIHLEGPFISAAKRGTHQASNVAAPDLELFHRWIADSHSTIRLITIAPELDPHHTIPMMAARYGVRVAMGHSNATFAEASAAADRGVRYAVHTFNAMRQFSHRDPGIAGAVLSDDRIDAEIIADGIHVDPAVVRIFSRSKGAGRTLLVTDAISATDMPDGEYRLGTGTVTVVNGVCRNAEGRLAGSTLTPELALKNFIAWTGWTLEDALLGLTANPARALGLDDKGVIRQGAEADLVVMDADFHVMKTFVAGKLVFDRSRV